MKQTTENKMEYRRTGKHVVTISGNPKDIKSILWHDTWRKVILWLTTMVGAAVMLSLHGEKAFSLLQRICKWAL